jgi:tetratricopeptide (TPR) repeat protein
MFNAAPFSSRRLLAFGTAAILLIVLVTYWPALRGQFVWDDLLLVDKNPLVTGKLDLRTVWFRTDFPLSMVGFWLQWLVWGKSAAGYHVVNVLLHALGATLFWRVLVKLKIPGAWIAAVLFAVHPLAAASVAWISELKNTLSLPFYLLSVWCFLHFEENASTADADAGARLSQPQQASTVRNVVETQGRWKFRDLLRLGQPRSGSWSFYWLALLAFLLALLSKTSTVMVPAVLVMCVWWLRGRLTPRDIARIAPFFALALVFGLLTIWFQRQAIGSVEVQSENFWARLADAGRAVWFYLGKAILPVHLNLIYPRWHLDPRAPMSYGPLLLLAVVAAICWSFRRRWGGPLLFALACFVLNLLPILGFLDMYYLALSRVSDHFAYLALMPVTALAAAGLSQVVDRSRRREEAEKATAGVRPPPRVGRYLASIRLLFVATPLVLVLAVETFQRAGVLAKDETLWRDTLAKNPAAWTARNNLGCILAEQGKYDEAIQQFVFGLELNPANAEAHCNLGRALAAKGQFDKAETHFQKALSIRPQNADIQRSYALMLVQRGKADAALPRFREALRLEPDLNTRLQFASLLYQTHHAAEAATQYRQVLDVKRDHPEALNNLAWLLATSGDSTVRNGAEAVQLAERACRVGRPNDPVPLGTLAAAYAEAGRFKEAVATAEKASELANRIGNTQFAAMNQQLLNYYKAGRPFHEP